MSSFNNQNNPERITKNKKINALRSILFRNHFQKLNGSPIRIPHVEHRQLHLTIYRRLDNPFVLGILEAFWDAYESARFNLYSDYHYLQDVWNYHQQMVNAICSGNFDAGHQALSEHTDLLYHHPEAMLSQDKR